MNPDPTPPLPPVLSGFSEPRFGELEVKARDGEEYKDVAGASRGDSEWTIGFYGHNSDFWHSLRLGSPIALANGIGVVTDLVLREGEGELFHDGQRRANEDFKEGTPSKSIRYMNADVSSGYSYEWNRLEALKEEPLPDAPVPEIRTKQMGEVAIATDGERSAIGTTEENARLLIHAMRGTAPEQAAKPEAEVVSHPLTTNSVESHESPNVSDKPEADYVPEIVLKSSPAMKAIREELEKLTPDERQKYLDYALSHKAKPEAGDGPDFEAAMKRYARKYREETLKNRELAKELTQANAAVGRFRELVEHALKEQMSMRPEFRDKWFVEAAEDVLSGKATPPAPDGWREISDNPPKDGTVVILNSCESSTIGHWEDNAGHPAGGPNYRDVWVDEANGYPMSDVTHWMPTGKGEA